MTVRFVRFASLLAIIMRRRNRRRSRPRDQVPRTCTASSCVRTRRAVAARYVPSHSVIRVGSFPAATGYQFQLSTNSTFRENAIVYNTNTLKRRSRRRPWCCHGSRARRHSLRPCPGDTQHRRRHPVERRLRLRHGRARSRDAYDERPGALALDPGRGAPDYQVWLIDVPKNGQGPGQSKEHTKTNVLRRTRAPTRSIRAPTGPPRFGGVFGRSAARRPVALSTVFPSRATARGAQSTSRETPLTSNVPPATGESGAAAHDL